ncbi:MAG: hypothetical protein NUV76_01535 [Candidatus Kuenenia sp.]|nr:hypothetical protein [Candidatus Kuenenia sp.]
MARPSLHPVPVEVYKERFNFAQYRIHHSWANHLACALIADRSSKNS